MIKAVIFDLDGVLTKSDHYHTCAWREVCRKWAIPFDERCGDLVRGISRLESAQLIVRQGGKQLSDEALKRFAEEKNQYYMQSLQDMTPKDVLPGVIELLCYLQRHHYAMAVASSSKNASLILEKTGLASYFSVVIDGNQISRSKPDPEVFQKAAQALMVPYEKCLVVEDAVSGIEAALALGAQAAYVGSATHAAGATYVLSETADLLPILEGRLMHHLRIHPRPVAERDNMIEADGYRITVLSDRLFRVEEGCCTDEATQAIWYRDFPKVPFSWEKKAQWLLIKTVSLTLKINTTTFSQSVVCFPDGSWAKLDNAENLFGTCSTLDTNGSHLRENPSIHQYDRSHIPLGMGVCARNGVAVYDDSQSLLLFPDGKLMPRRDGRDIYVFAYGHDYYGAVQMLYKLCGNTPVIPRWALGNWWCRYWPYTQQEYLNLMDNFADDEIPISVAVIDMDWHYVNIDQEFGIRASGLEGEAYGGIDGWTGYTWNEHLFPNHRALLTELHRRGMHTTLNLHPALGVRWYEKPYSEMAQNMGMDPQDKLVIPFQISEERFVNNYFNLLHHPLEREGVDFWWIDWQQGKKSGLEGLDPLWALNHYHYLDHAYRSGEGLILSRYAGVGSHRYPVGFSGDIHMDWEFLDYMPYFTATAANVGYGWWSHDIGGHHRGLRDEECYLRWLQFGVFSPINRIHCCPAVVTSKEPWTFSAPTRAVAEKWFRFRHKLVPYLYSASWKNTLEGIPLIRPMYYQWPEEDAAYEADHQYLFGDLLVAPITKRSEKLGIAEKRVWLPAGMWTDIFTGDSYKGGRWIKLYRDSGSMPVFAREGTILPLSGVMKNDCPEPDSLDVWVFRGSGKYTLLEGDTRAIYFDQQIVGEHAAVLRICGGQRKMKYHLYFKDISDGECYTKEQSTIITVRRNRCLQAQFTLEAGECAELFVTWRDIEIAEICRERILKIFIMLQLDNWYKENQWNKTKALCTTEEWMEWIEQLQADSVEKSMLKEQLYAYYS